MGHTYGRCSCRFAFSSGVAAGRDQAAQLSKLMPAVHEQGGDQTPTAQIARSEAALLGLAVDAQGIEAGGIADQLQAQAVLVAPEAGYQASCVTSASRRTSAWNASASGCGSSTSAASVRKPTVTLPS